MSELSFYYDFSCPWSYLALVRLHDVADRNGTSINLYPVNVATVLATENPAKQANRLAANPTKAAWQRADLQLWAKFWGLTINVDDSWPQDSALAAAAATVATANGRGIDYSLGLYAAHFAAGADITDQATLLRIATEAGLEAAVIEAGITAAAIEVSSRSEELIRRGGFGTPSVFVGEQLFFGNDRIPLVDWVIGPISDDSFVMPGQHG
jgi:2-hydroxychromene-2-carboxylate isomerase